MSFSILFMGIMCLVCFFLIMRLLNILALLSWEGSMWVHSCLAQKKKEKGKKKRCITVWSFFNAPSSYANDSRFFRVALLLCLCFALYFELQNLILADVVHLEKFPYIIVLTESASHLLLASDIVIVIFCSSLLQLF